MFVDTQDPWLIKRFDDMRLVEILFSKQIKNENTCDFCGKNIPTGYGQEFIYTGEDVRENRFACDACREQIENGG